MKGDSVEVPDILKEDFSIFFNHMADHRMVDSPDGPYATRMRELACVDTLDDTALDEVRGRCAGTIALNREQVDAAQQLANERGVLIGLTLLAGNPEAVQEAERLMHDREQDRALPTYVAAALNIHTYFAFQRQAEEA